MLHVIAAASQNAQPRNHQKAMAGMKRRLNSGILDCPLQPVRDCRGGQGLNSAQERWVRGFKRESKYGQSKKALFPSGAWYNSNALVGSVPIFPRAPAGPRAGHTVLIKSGVGAKSVGKRPILPVPPATVPDRDIVKGYRKYFINGFHSISPFAVLSESLAFINFKLAKRSRIPQVFISLIVRTQNGSAPA